MENTNARIKQKPKEYTQADAMVKLDIIERIAHSVLDEKEKVKEIKKVLSF